MKINNENYNKYSLNFIREELRNKKLKKAYLDLIKSQIKMIEVFPENEKKLLKELKKTEDDGFSRGMLTIDEILKNRFGIK